MPPKLCSRAACLLFALLLALSPLSLSAEARETAFFDTPAHADMRYADMYYERYDSAAFYSRIGELRTLSEERGNDDAILALYEELLFETERVYTLTVLASILYYQDISSEERQAEDIAMTQLQEELFDAFACEIASLLDSRHYGDMFADYIGEDRAWQYFGYQAMTEEQKAFSEHEQALVQRYYTLSRQEYPGLAAENEVIGGVYLELLALRNESAWSYGYDNYADLANENYYFRDYGREEMQELFANVKKYIVPAYHRIGSAFSDRDQEVVGNYRPPEAAEIEEAIGRHMDDLSSELGEAWRYMARNGLYDGEPVPSKTDISFTVSLPQWNSAFILQGPQGGVHDIFTLLHEFGHFAQEFYDDTPAMYMTPMFDLLEIHSQGLELLCTRYYDDLFGLNADIFRYELVYNMLYAIVNYSFLAELELAVYAGEDVTLEDINELCRSIAAEYGADPDGEDSAYFWVYFSHMITAPMYSASYVVSALAALDIWMQSLVDPDFAADTYLTLASLHSEVLFREALAWAGCSDIFDGETLRLMGDNLIGVLTASREPHGVVLERPRELADGEYRVGGDNDEYPPRRSARRPLSVFAVPVGLASVTLAGGLLILVMRRR